MNPPDFPRLGPKRNDDVVRLEDLAPREEVKGGTRKRLFGQSIALLPTRGPLNS